MILGWAPTILLGQWKKNVAIIHLHDSTYSVKREPFQISTYGDSGVCIFGSAIYDGLTYAGSRAIEAEVSPVDGSFLRSSSPRKLSQSNDSYSSVSFSFPYQDRVLVRNRYSSSTVQIDSVSLRVTSKDSVLVIYEGDWEVIEHTGAQAGSEVWLRKIGEGLICKKIDLGDASELQFLDLEHYLNDSLFEGKSPPYSLKNILVDGSKLIVDFTRIDNSFIDPISGFPFLEEATLSIDTVTLNVSNSKYVKAPTKPGGVGTSKESDRILYLNETSIRDMRDTTLRKSLVLYDYANNSSLNISFRTKFYINILGYETVPGSFIYTENGFYLMVTSIINFPPNGRNLEGVRLALFDSTGQVLYDIQTNNEWVPLYYNQVRISKRGEVYFNIQEQRPSDRTILGKIDLNGINPLFKKSPWSSPEVGSTGDLFSVFPNPARDYVEVKGITTLVEIKVVNGRGELVYSSSTVGNQYLLKTRDFARGLYFITVRSMKGELSTQKVMLE